MADNNSDNKPVICSIKLGGQPIVSAGSVLRECRRLGRPTSWMAYRPNRFFTSSRRLGMEPGEGYFLMRNGDIKKITMSGTSAYGSPCDLVLNSTPSEKLVIRSLFLDWAKCVLGAGSSDENSIYLVRVVDGRFVVDRNTSMATVLFNTPVRNRLITYQTSDVGGQALDSLYYNAKSNGELYSYAEIAGHLLGAFFSVYYAGEAGQLALRKYLADHREYGDEDATNYWYLDTPDARPATFFYRMARLTDALYAALFYGASRLSIDHQAEGSQIGLEVLAWVDTGNAEVRKSAAPYMVIRDDVICWPETNAFGYYGAWYAVSLSVSPTDLASGIALQSSGVQLSQLGSPADEQGFGFTGDAGDLPGAILLHEPGFGLVGSDAPGGADISGFADLARQGWRTYNVGLTPENMDKADLVYADGEFTGRSAVYAGFWPFIVDSVIHEIEWGIDTNGDLPYTTTASPAKQAAPPLPFDRPVQQICAVFQLHDDTDENGEAEGTGEYLERRCRFWLYSPLGPLLKDDVVVATLAEGLGAYDQQRWVIHAAICNTPGTENGDNPAQAVIIGGA